MEKTPHKVILNIKLKLLNFVNLQDEDFLVIAIRLVTREKKVHSPVTQSDNDAVFGKFIRQILWFIRGVQEGDVKPAGGVTTENNLADAINGTFPFDVVIDATAFRLTGVCIGTPIDPAYRSPEIRTNTLFVRETTGK